MKPKRVAVLGAGSWGTAFSTLLAENGYEVVLWCYEEEVASSIETDHVNKQYLPGVILDEKIKPTTSLQQALEDDITWVFEVIPVKFMRTVLQQAKPYYAKDQVWVILSKGIENETLFLPSQIIDDVFGYHEKKVTISGPNFAKDFAEKSYTATTIAAKDCDLGRSLQEILANDYFRPYLSLDLIGVQVGGAIKNAITLLIGIAKGAGFKDNTIAFLLTRGLAEMVQIVHYFGGKTDTIYGLSGLGDLVLTSMGSHGRNLKVGIMLGQGQSLDDILTSTGLIPEGVNTIRSLRQIIEKGKLDLPLCKGTYEIVFEQRSIKSLLDEIMAQPLTEECLYES